MLWYASKLFISADKDIPQQAKAIHDVAGLIKTIPDKVLQEYYTEQLISTYGHGKMWEREILGIQSLPEPVANATLSDKDYAELFKGTEINVSNNHYYCYCKEGEKEISNFIMIPLYLIRDGASASRVFILRNVMNYEVRIEFSIDLIVEQIFYFL